MKIVYFGSPEESAAVLENLLYRHTVIAVVTNPDAPVKRSGTPVPNPVSIVAQKHNISRFTFNSLKKENASSLLGSLGADIFVVFSYGHIIPSDVYTIPPYGTINLHPSLLPAYRGASPVQSALMDGCTYSGITVQTISADLDAGDIVIQEKMTLDGADTTGEVMRRVISRGSEMIDEAIERLSKGYQPVPQNSEGISFCAKITKESSRINWTITATKIHNLIRALNPKPYAWTTLQGKQIKIIASRLSEHTDAEKQSPGTFRKLGKKRLVVECGEGAIEIITIQPEGRKVMEASAFMNGLRDEQGCFE